MTRRDQLRKFTKCEKKSTANVGEVYTASISRHYQQCLCNTPSTNQSHNALQVETHKIYYGWSAHSQGWTLTDWAACSALSAADTWPGGGGGEDKEMGRRMGEGRRR